MDDLAQQQAMQLTNTTECILCEMKKHPKEHENLLKCLAEWEGQVRIKLERKESPNDDIVKYFDEYETMRTDAELGQSNLLVDARRMGLPVESVRVEVVPYKRIQRILFENHFLICNKKIRGTQEEMHENVDASLVAVSENLKHYTGILLADKGNFPSKEIRKVTNNTVKLAQILIHLKRVQNSNTLSSTAKDEFR